MSNSRLDLLADMARNRGLRIVRSRVRKPGKPRFGAAGLTDELGKAVFGMDSSGPIATPERVEDYLRKLEAQDWGASLGATKQPRKKEEGEPAATAARRQAAAPQAGSRAQSQAHVEDIKSKRKHEPEVREAELSDARSLVSLIGELETKIDEEQVRMNLAALRKSGEMPLVATLAAQVVGLCGVGRRVAVHRPAPLGRITVLVVSREMRGQGVGRMLVEAAETWMRQRGCYLVEVTSADRRSEAHAFYRHMGYERTSIRFAKQL